MADIPPLDIMQCVLVTGASSGIGRATAGLLSRRGLHVFATVRNTDDVKALRDEMPENLTPLLMDVRRQEAIESAVAEVTRAVGDGERFAGLVNNAGVPSGGPLECLPLDRFRDQLDVNLLGTLAVTQAFLPLLRGSRGRIVNINSISGLVTIAYRGPYAATKAALNVLTESLRMEVRPWGVFVTGVFPGRVKTAIWGKAVRAMEEVAEDAPARARELYDGFFSTLDRFKPCGIPPERVGEAVAHALLSPRPRRRYIVGREAHLLLLVSRLPAGIRESLFRMLARCSE